MDNKELLDIVSELIVNNSNIGAESDDSIMIDGVEDVMFNESAEDADVTILFTDGTVSRLTAESVENESIE